MCGFGLGYFLIRRSDALDKGHIIHLHILSGVKHHNFAEFGIVLQCAAGLPDGKTATVKDDIPDMVLRLGADKRVTARRSGDVGQTDVANAAAPGVIRKTDHKRAVVCLHHHVVKKQILHLKRQDV